MSGNLSNLHEIMGTICPSAVNHNDGIYRNNLKLEGNGGIAADIRRQLGGHW